MKSALRWLALILPLTLHASWPQWRGPGGQGHADGKLPTTWSETENVVWKTLIPGRGWSAPVLLGKQVWLTTAFETPFHPKELVDRPKDDKGEPIDILAQVELHAIGMDRDSGKVLHSIPLLNVPKPQMVHKQNSYASPAPVIEEDRLFAHFGTYGTVCVDTKSGEIVWKNEDLHIEHENGPGSCPILWKNLLIFHMDGSDVQFIVALDKVTGKIVWKTARSGKMNENKQLKKAYGTPLVTQLGGKDQLLSNAADWLYAYDPATGKELWKMAYGRLGFSNVARPVIGHGMIYLPTGFSKSQMFGIKADGKGKAEIAWEYKRNVPTTPSPILVGEALYFVSDQGGLVTCLDAKSGELIWKERAGGNAHWASPLYGDGKLYFHSEEGLTMVLKPGQAFEKLAENQLDGLIMGSAAASEDSLFIRTDKALYRISEATATLADPQ